MSTSPVDQLFEQSAERSWRDMTEEALLSFQFTASDPESLDGITEDPPPSDEDPEIEFRYDMAGRGEMVRCVYCKHPNHFKGIVVKYMSGRRLVGRNCALNHHGVAFEKDLLDFEAAIERQSLIRRRRALMAARAHIHQHFTELKADPAVETHDRTMRRWRADFRDLALAMVNLARRDERLTISRKERDEAAEKLRKQRLGDRFDAERQRAKAAGETWQIYRTIEEDLGSLRGALFFTNGVPVATRLDEIHASVQQVLKTLAEEDLQSKQISTGFRKLSELRDALAFELDRLEALAEAFSADNLARIAKWTNELAAEEIRLAAVMANQKPGHITARFTTDGQSITDRAGLHTETISLTTVYRPAPRTLLTILKEALALDYEP
ncbi:hypothetical protein [Microvirga arabica]|uniref:hypothetical protein n=1 Tax=Microvirga arabica TaxID=1128671 RepID=UPI001939BEA5|nr:hypothetical protein [Microvirga arabica]MBM1170088.1 hypothetical protein [Microvirga arabica]